MLATLLLAAVQAGRYVVFQALTKIPAVANITSGDVMQLLRGAFQTQLWQHYCFQAALIVGEACKLAQASVLSSAELTELLVAAASLEVPSSAVERYDVAVRMLCYLESRAASQQRAAVRGVAYGSAACRWQVHSLHSYVFTVGTTAAEQ
jgi:hypothetical protein